MSVVYSALLKDLIDALRCLPGVGPKSAQRMAFHLLHAQRDAARELASALAKAADDVGHCTSCRMLTENPQCQLCLSPRRDDSVLCVVETPADVAAVELSGGFNGRYFVLMGHLSPLDGIGPQELGLDQLEQRLADAAVKEVIVATNPTVEGEATAHFVAQLAARHSVRATRIAHGVPVGGELEYVDGGTLSHALAGRQTIT